jgi:hypothetical protein
MPVDECFCAPRRWPTAGWKWNPSHAGGHMAMLHIATSMLVCYSEREYLEGEGGDSLRGRGSERLEPPPPHLPMIRWPCTPLSEAAGRRSVRPHDSEAASVRASTCGPIRSRA